MTEAVAVGQDQVQEPVLIEIGLDVFKCKEYDHFAKDCPYSHPGKPEQIQQMYILDEDQTALKV